MSEGRLTDEDSEPLNLSSKEKTMRVSDCFNDDMSQPDDSFHDLDAMTDDAIGFDPHEEYEDEDYDDEEYDEDDDDEEEWDDDEEPWDGFRDDAEADADALASAGFGTDEDYGYYGEPCGEEW